MCTSKYEVNRHKNYVDLFFVLIFFIINWFSQADYIKSYFFLLIYEKFI